MFMSLIDQCILIKGDRGIHLWLRAIEQSSLVVHQKENEYIENPTFCALNFTLIQHKSVTKFVTKFVIYWLTIRRMDILKIPTFCALNVTLIQHRKSVTQFVSKLVI